MVVFSPRSYQGSAAQLSNVSVEKLEASPGKAVAWNPKPFFSEDLFRYFLAVYYGCVFKVLLILGEIAISF